MRDIVSSAILMPFVFLLLGLVIIGLIRTYGDQLHEHQLRSNILSARIRPSLLVGDLEHEGRAFKLVDAELLHVSTDLAMDLKQIVLPGGDG